jgi:hypothetical protein
VGNLDGEDDGTAEAAKRLAARDPPPRPHCQQRQRGGSDSSDEGDIDEGGEKEEEDEFGEDEELSSCVKPLLDRSDFTRLLARPQMRSVAGLLVSLSPPPFLLPLPFFF